ncbi:MAG: ABC transporter permease subunit [Chloroflexi bacterium]|nr:ABC transporter permease subunit [Chloroflexota bacterium]
MAVADITGNIAVVPRSIAGWITGIAQRWRRLPIVSVALLLLGVVAGAGADLIAPHDPENGDLANRNLPPFWGGPTTTSKLVVEQPETGKRHLQVPLDEAQEIDPNAAVGDTVDVITRAEGSSEFLLGTDHLGRDLLSRVIHGARISLIVALVTLGVGGILGVILGLMAGWYGGWTDEFLMRLVDIILSLPLILVALVLVVAVGQSLEIIVVVLALWIWPRFARMVRGEVLQLKTMDYVALARVAGASTTRILLKHLFPGTINTLIVVATLQVGIVILVEATLSFLGAGVPPPEPAWGSMVADGRDRLTDAWWIATVPGIAILLTVMSLNLFGDWLRDRLDPRLRQI